MTYECLSFLSPVLCGLAAVPLLAYCKVCSLVTDLDDELQKDISPKEAGMCAACSII